MNSQRVECNEKKVVLGLALGLCVVASILIVYELNRSPGIVVPFVTLPAVPDKLMVYKIPGLHSSDEAAIELAKKFGIAGPLTHDDCYIHIKNSDSSLYLSVPKKPGLGVHFYNETAWNFSEPIDAPENLPSYEQAIVIANKFLKERGLYPEGDTMRSIAYETRNGTGKDGTEISRREMISVNYNRTLNGLGVEGNSQGVNVGVIGRPGFVASYYSQWWSDYKPYGEFPLKRP